MNVLMRLIILGMFVVVYNMHAEPLIMLFDTEKAETLQAPFYVSYQLATALHQQPSPIFISSSLLRNITDRAQIFSQKMNDKTTVECSIQQLWLNMNNFFKKMDSYPSNASSLFNRDWLIKNFPQLSNNDTDLYKQAAFNFLCFHLMADILLWDIYQITPHFILLIPPLLQHESQFTNFSRISYQKVNPDKGDSGELVQALAKVVSLFSMFSKFPLNIYLSGHGEYADENDKGMIAGLPAENFSSLLDQLQKSGRMNLLVYNSCYGGGKNTILPYQNAQISGKKFNYTIVNISITDAPTYMFGFPEGMKLPPYDGVKYLLPTDLDKQNNVTFYFLQNFPQFFDLATQTPLISQCIESVNPYIHCLQPIAKEAIVCDVSHVENIPMILTPGATRFISFDKKYINQMHGVKLLDTNRYLSLQLSADQRLLPIDTGNYWYQIDVLQGQTQETIIQFIQRVFLFIPDLMTPYVLYIPTLNIKEKVYQRVVLLHQVSVGPASTQAANCKVLLYYEESGKYYAACFENEAWKVLQLNDDVQKNMLDFIALAASSAINRQLQDQQDAIKNYYQNTKLASLFASQCVQQNICKKLTD